MKQLYTFTITGMTCHACEKLITMDLDEAGFTPKTINHQTGELVIEIEPTEVGKIKQVIQSGNTYTVTEVKPIN